jgi:hypothetical protein
VFFVILDEITKKKKEGRTRYPFIKEKEGRIIRHKA